MDSVTSVSFARGQRDAGRPDGQRHDPMTAALPGTEPYDVLRRQREPAYRAARRIRPRTYDSS
ncbi:MAG: hypothetical protein QOF35_1291 [Actinomycetota bacterium]|nr:hypothetical protein [Actinomycetota bacterium]